MLSKGVAEIKTASQEAQWEMRLDSDYEDL
jgi:hypothetical protein